MKFFKHGQAINLNQAASIVEKISGKVSVSFNGSMPESYAASEVVKSLKDNKDGWKVANVFQNYGNGAFIVLKDGNDVAHLHLEKDFEIEAMEYILKV